MNKDPFGDSLSESRRTHEGHPEEHAHEAMPWTDEELRAAWRSTSFPADEPQPSRKGGRVSSWGPSKRVPRQALFNLYVGLIYAIGITGFYGYLFFEFEQRWIRIGLALMMLFNVLLAGMSLPLVAKFHQLKADQPVLGHLRHLRDDLRAWWSLQRWMAGGALPLAAATGFLMGGVIGSGDPHFVAFEDKWPLVGVMVGLSLAAVPLGLKLGDWFYKHSYAKDLQRVEAWIEELEGTARHPEERFPEGQA